MDYLVLTSDFCIKEFEEQLKIEPYDYSKQGLNVDHVDDFYADHDNFGFYTDDEKNCLAHALLMIKNIQENRDEKQEIIQNWKDSLVKDFSNYFQCLALDNGEYDSTVNYIIEGMAEEGLGVQLADQIENYYTEDYTEECCDEDNYKVVALDYENTYKKIGDRFLFLKTDIKSAMRFYRLANIDWFFLRRDIKFDYNINDPKRFDEMEQWNSTYQFYDSVIKHKTIPNNLPQFPKQEETYFQVIKEILDLVNSGGNCDEIIGLAEKFMRLYFEYKSGHPDISVCRDLLVMSYVIRQSSLMLELATVDNMPDINNKTKQNIINTINIIGDVFQGASLDIARYVEKHSKDTNLFNVVSLLAQTYIHGCEIKYQLKVREPSATVAYYTSLDTLMKMLPPQQIDSDKYGKPAIMHFAYMDDPTEGEVLFDHLCTSEVPGEESRTDVEYPLVFMKCFTSLVDDLPMWEMYGDHARGCCIVIDWEKTVSSNADKQEIPLYRVCYLDNQKNEIKINEHDNPEIKNKQKIEELLKTLKDIVEKLKDCDAGDDFKSLLGELPYLFKSSNYAHEQELRIIFNCMPTDADIKHTDDQVPKLYVQSKFMLVIKEIIFGPKFEDLSLKLPYIQEQVALMCKKNKVTSPEYTYSSIEYK